MDKVKTYPLISIRSDATVQDAARLMVDCRIGALGVLGPKQEFAGIITERDLSRLVALARDPVDTKVSAIATSSPVVIDGPITDEEALERMRNARIRHLIVRVGTDFSIISMRDLIPDAKGAGSLREPVVADLMTAPAIACRDEALFEEIADVLADRDISGMPVVDKLGQVVGVISERDLAHALGGPMVRLALRRSNHGPRRPAIDRGSWGQRRAKDVMTSPPVTVSPQTRLDEVARLLRVHKINRIPVVDGARLVGVVTRGDVLAAIAHLEHRQIDLTLPAELVGSDGMYFGIDPGQDRSRSALSLK
ncbi:MAG: CBS domain-containing protein [Actinomycetota bacterium]|nr:CBS domain-containing protein [Actinomycetota bacterium]